MKNGGATPWAAKQHFMPAQGISTADLITAARKFDVEHYPYMPKPAKR